MSSSSSRRRHVWPAGWKSSAAPRMKVPSDDRYDLAMSRGAPLATISLGQKAQSKAQLKLTPSVAMLMGSTPDLRRCVCYGGDVSEAIPREPGCGRP